MTRFAAFVVVCVILSGLQVPDEAAAITLIHEFAGGADDGAFPLAGLALSGSTLYGTAFGGGDAGYGTVFSMNTDGSSFTLLHEFAGGANDGRGPTGELTRSGSTYFGATNDGGDHNYGTVYSMNVDGSGFTLLHEFVGGPDDGRYPNRSVLTLSGSTLFGITRLGGLNDRGTIFSMNTDGSGYTLLHRFTGGASDGYWPRGGLTLSGSTLFGATSHGGDANNGTIFSINTDGTGFTLLHEFAGGVDDGNSPLAGLTLSGSTLYSTTQGGGDQNLGTIFSINTDGSGFALLHEFAGGTADGRQPSAGLSISGSTLYGTTYEGGDSDLGTLFSINTDGSGYTLLHEFAGGAEDGSLPEAEPIIAGSTLYGTTERGGDHGLGTVFSIEIPELGLPGDYNDNGTVDAADYVVWRKTGINGPTAYDTWRSHFGQTAGSGSASSSHAAVPEPASALLLIFGAALGIFRVRRVGQRVLTTR